MDNNDYRIIKLPKELADLVDEMLGSMGYKTRTEFVKDAVRRLLSAYNIPKRGATSDPAKSAENTQLK